MINFHKEIKKKMLPVQILTISHALCGFSPFAIFNRWVLLAYTTFSNHFVTSLNLRTLVPFYIKKTKLFYFIGM